MGTFVVAIVLVILVVMIIKKIVNDKKAGKSSCGCDCNGCAGSCHSSHEDAKN
ncbi:MAG: FeoB-associated Cys-rich membrane protein [Lachnospirales bacterium]